MNIEGAIGGVFRRAAPRSWLTPPRERTPDQVFRTQVLFAAALFAGIFVGLPVTFMLIGQLSIVALYAAFGAITAVPVAIVMWREVGPGPAVLAALMAGVLAGLLMFALGQGACAASSCAR